jgi:hypothetical protein
VALIGGAVVIVAVAIVGLISLNGLTARAYVYDDFNNPAYEGNYNLSLWGLQSGSLKDVTQRSGSLTLSQETTGEITGLYTKNYSDMTLQSPIFFEAKLKQDADQNAGNVMMGLVSEKLDTNCMLAPLDNAPQSANCWISLNNTQVASFSPSDKKIAPASWHTFRIEFDPGYGVFTFFMDDEKLGSYPVDAAQLRDARPTFTLRAHKTMASSVGLKGYFDDVRIGPLQK